MNNNNNKVVDNKGNNKGGRYLKYIKIKKIHILNWYFVGIYVIIIDCVI